MSTPVVLHGYRHSVYTWIARMVLVQADVTFDTVEENPFADPPVVVRKLHPFGRVPTLVHDDFVIFETTAISRYINREFANDTLTPDCAKAQARMDQVIAITDSYGYVPLVRQVFAHAVFRPWEGERVDPEQITAGIDAARPVLAALDRIAAEGHVLNAATITLADCHLAPMIGYFLQADEGRIVMEDVPALARWWDLIAHTPSLVATQPKRGVQST